MLMLWPLLAMTAIEELPEVWMPGRLAPENSLRDVGVQAAVDDGLNAVRGEAQGVGFVGVVLIADRGVNRVHILHDFTGDGVRVDAAA